MLHVHMSHRAEVHGEEMLKHISKFLLGSTSHALPIAMVIEGLVALCRGEVTDVATLWGVLDGPRHSQWKLVDDKRLKLALAARKNSIITCTMWISLGLSWWQPCVSCLS